MYAIYVFFFNIKLKDLWQNKQLFTDELYFQVFVHSSLPHNYQTLKVAFYYCLIRLCAVLGPVPKDASR